MNCCSGERRGNRPLVTKGLWVFNNQKVNKVKLHIHVNCKHCFYYANVSKWIPKSFIHLKIVIFILTEGFGELQSAFTNMKGNRQVCLTRIIKFK